MPSISQPSAPSQVSVSASAIWYSARYSPSGSSTRSMPDPSASAMKTSPFDSSDVPVKRRRDPSSEISTPPYM